MLLKEKVLNFVKKDYFVIVIFVIVFLIGLTNIEKGKYLIGWDNLMPEFNFGVNIIERCLFGVWQEYQGLGILAGNGHAADLFRQIFLWLLSVILPNWFLRYFYHLLMLLVGGIGIYCLINYILSFENRKKENGFLIKLVAFLGSSYYLLNLGTIQNFYAPYEAFSHNYAFLPWLILVLLEYLEKPDKKKLLKLTLVNLLAVAMNYIPTIFLVYLGVLGIIYAVYFFIKPKKEWFKNTIKSGLVIIGVNSFWLLPFTYFVLNGTGFVTEITINRMFTQEAFLRNQKFGDFKDVVKLKGFWFDTTDLVNTNGDHKFMMEGWQNYVDKPLVSILIYLIFGIIIIGVILSIFKKKKFNYIFLLFLLVSLFALINDNFPTGWLFRFFQNHLPFFKQVLRFPFTKFIVLASLSYSIFFAWGIYGILEFVEKSKKFKKFGIIILFTLIVSLIIFVGFPVFKGEFFYSKLKQEVPNEYFELFKYFENQKDKGRIANLPQPTFWGWVNYDWGYRGSGFPWYGISQPIMDRAFDVWSPELENYYHELSYAIYGNNEPELFFKVLDKYNVRYVWFDDRVIAPHKPKLLDMDKVKKWMNGSNLFDKTFENGGQLIYKRNFFDNNTFNISGISNKSQFSSFDSYYFNNGDYFEDESVNYVFSDLDSYKHKWNINDGKLNINIGKGQLFIDDFGDNNVIRTKIKREGNKLNFEILEPNIFLDNKRINFPKEFGSIELLELLDDKNTVLVINNSIIDFGKEEYYLKENNKLEIYDLNGSEYKEIVFNSDNLPIRNCSLNVDNNTVFGAIYDNNLIEINGNKANPCIYNNFLTFFGNDKWDQNYENYIINFSFNTFAEKNTEFEICLTKEGEGSCFYKKTYKQNEKNWENWIETVVVKNILLDKLWLKFELKAEDKNDQRISIRDLQTKIINNAIYSSNLSYKNLTNSSNYEIKDESLFSVNLFDYLNKEIKTAQLNTNPNNCYEYGSNDYKREILKDENGENFVRYSSYNSSSCETINLNNIEDKEGLLIEINTRNISGRPIKICLRNDPPGNCLVENLVTSDNSDWNSSYYFVPPVYVDANLFLELDNLAVGEEKRINDVSEIKIYSIPYKLLKKIKLVSDKNNRSNYDGKLLSEKDKLLNLNWLYVYKNIDYKVNIITLPQAFNNGWIGIQTQNKKQETGNKKNGIFAYEILPHFKVNNWANGWEINKKLETRNLKQDEQVIYIIFWPQILEFLGFGILIGLGGWIILRRAKS